MLIALTNLRYIGGGSDKEYHCGINEVSVGNYTVPFAYGRTGSTLIISDKCNMTVPFAEAQKIYNKLVAEKTGKGYLPTGITSGDILGTLVNAKGITPSGDVPSLMATTMQTMITKLKKGFPAGPIPSGVLPQLLNAITEEEALKYLLDDAWGLQEKMDGELRGVVKTSGSWEGTNKKGLFVPLHPAIKADFEKNAWDGAMFGEEIGDQFYVFDVKNSGTSSFTGMGYHERFKRLILIASNCQYKNVHVVPLYTGVDAKRDFFRQAKMQGKEGVVFKKLDAVFTEGRPNSGGDQLKCKFWESATCRVKEITSGKRSVALQGFDVRSLKWKDIGNVTIPPNKDVPDPGDFVEVQYLYYYEDGSLYQPIYLKRRTDVDFTDCDLAKLKIKGQPPPIFKETAPAAPKKAKGNFVPDGAIHFDF